MEKGRDVVNIVDYSSDNSSGNSLRVRVRIEALGCIEGEDRVIRVSLGKAFLHQFHLIGSHNCYVLGEQLSATWGRGDGGDDEWLYMDVYSATGVDDMLVIERALYEVECARKLLSVWEGMRKREGVNVEYVL